MKKRKIFMLIAGGALCFALSACGTENTNGGNDTPEQTTGSADAAVAAQIPETAEQPASAEQSVETTQEEETVDAPLETGDNERGTYPDGSSPEYSGVKCRLTVDGEEIVIAMYDNTAAEAFLERLPLESGLEILAEKTEDFTGTIALME